MAKHSFKGVYRLQEGHYFTYKNGVMDIHEYWDADYSHKENYSKEDWVQKSMIPFKNRLPHTKSVM